MKKITKCVIPAAGFGTRFLPATKALPKEMFPIIDKPVMQMLVEEAISAGCTDIIIVTGRSKRAIEDHFDSNFELEERLDKSGKFDYLQTVKGLNTLANIVYVRQPYPKGDGDAILRTKNLIGDEPFLVLFGDDLIDNEVSGAKQLVETYYRKNNPIISTILVNDNEVSNYGIIEVKNNEGDVFSVAKFLEKPKASETKSRYGVIGKYVLTPDIFDYLERVPNGKDGELRLADAFELMRREKDIYGLKIKGVRYDTGSKIGFLKATVNYALKNDEIKDEFKEYLKEIVSVFDKK
ncbi:MAG: UTP--glucose-1-phosphate uridylyltransferase [Candidatus Gracilibacteria bacterium]|nr:UTP--glucose-1-phosphate uridylyltransferase [Candidatus Gracilibacteria bacterium]